MNLVDTLAEAFKKSLQEVFDRERNEPKYMKQTILGCRWRAFWGVVVAVKNSGIIRILALAIAEHRQEKHGENKKGTIKSLNRSMTSDQVQKSKVQAGWLV